MTLTKRYDEVMEKINVTDAMRQRILANIDQMDLTAGSQAKVVRFPTLKRLMPIAACFVLLVAGVFAVRQFEPRGTIDPRPTGDVSVGIGNEIVDVADAGALSEAVGFSVKEPHALPFQADEVRYTAFWGEMAQITYTGAGQTVTFRQSLGTEDNSGDYNEYPQTETLEIGEASVTLKGEGQTYSLAVWSDGTYSYSFTAENGLTATEWGALISAVQGDE